MIDVACGTGVLALAALDRVGRGGQVVGLDPNADMLRVARRKSTRIDWRGGRAEQIPFPDGSFDAAVSQFGLMFFEDRPASLREMMRVLKRAVGWLSPFATCSTVRRVTRRWRTCWSSFLEAT